jgi:hypothetical protein
MSCADGVTIPVDAGDAHRYGGISEIVIASRRPLLSAVSSVMLGLLFCWDALPPRCAD